VPFAFLIHREHIAECIRIAWILRNAHSLYPNKRAALQVFLCEGALLSQEGRRKTYMKHLPVTRHFNLKITASTMAVIFATVSAGAELNTRKFSADQKQSFKGVVLSHEGDTLKVRGDDDSIGTIELTDETKIQLKRGVFNGSSPMKPDALAIGLYIDVRGEGRDNGDLSALKITFKSNSETVSRQADARVVPVEARASALETRAGNLEGRAGELETQQAKLNEEQKQIDQHVTQVRDQVGEVKTEAHQANKGVDSLNQRVANLDHYREKYADVVYFSVNSATLTSEDKQKLVNLARRATNEKGYSIEIAGYTDKTGSPAYNQRLSDARASAVIHYLIEQSNIPIYRILTPAGMSATHDVADNRTSAGRKLNRRVEVKVLVNEGLIADSTRSAAAAGPELPAGTALSSLPH
jgi:outer membrane protein OmpA-like peptidoglycan-associated protein